MRYIEPDQPESEELTETTEQRLRREIEELKKKLREQSSDPKPPPPSRTALWLFCIGVVVVLVAAFYAGYLPRQKRETLIQTEARDQAQALPAVDAVPVVRSSSASELVLPGNIQAVTEAPILARADGYLKSRSVDIGDRVKAGQIVAEIEAPELAQQVTQAKATLQQSEASLEQAQANYQQAKANEALTRSNAQRQESLVQYGIITIQQNEEYQSAYQVAQANSQALEKAINAARSTIAANQANLARLTELQQYTSVRAPFAGIITLRNVDVGALITSGTTLLFRVAQTDVLRTYVNVPQTDAASVRVRQAAQLSIASLPGRKFAGTVARTANALDPSSRTLLVEVQVPNAAGLLLPGMYASVDLNTQRTNPPLLIPGDTLIVRADGTQVAVVRPDQTIHFQKITIGRDFGDRIEVLDGLADGDLVVSNPSDAAKEGAKVRPVTAAGKSAAKGSDK